MDANQRTEGAIKGQRAERAINSSFSQFIFFLSVLT
jgi:hypothetical protein